MEYEIKVQDLIEHIRFGTQMKYDIKDYIVAIEGLLDLYNKEKEKNKKLIEGQVETIEKIIQPELFKKYISKDKLREKIKELEKDYEEYKDSPEWEIFDETKYAYELLQELLEE